MIKRVCDICNEEVLSTNPYTVPHFNKVYAMHNGKRILSFNDGISAKEMDLCDKCINTIACFIETLENNNTIKE